MSAPEHSVDEQEIFEEIPQMPDQGLILDESENENEFDDIVNDADSDDEQDDVGGRSYSIHNRPRRGNAFYNDDPFMKGKYIVLQAKPCNPDDPDRQYECCLCQVIKNIIETVYAIPYILC